MKFRLMIIAMAALTQCAQASSDPLAILYDKKENVYRPYEPNVFGVTHTRGDTEVFYSIRGRIKFSIYQPGIFWFLHAEHEEEEDVDDDGRIKVVLHGKTTVMKALQSTHSYDEAPSESFYVYEFKFTMEDETLEFMLPQTKKSDAFRKHCMEMLNRTARRKSKAKPQNKNLRPVTEVITSDESEFENKNIFSGTRGRAKAISKNDLGDANIVIKKGIKHRGTIIVGEAIHFEPGPHSSFYEWRSKGIAQVNADWGYFEFRSDINLINLDAVQRMPLKQTTTMNWRLTEFDGSEAGLSKGKYLVLNFCNLETGDMLTITTKRGEIFQKICLEHGKCAVMNEDWSAHNEKLTPKK